LAYPLHSIYCTHASFGYNNATTKPFFFFFFFYAYTSPKKKKERKSQMLMYIAKMPHVIQRQWMNNAMQANATPTYLPSQYPGALGAPP